MSNYGLNKYHIKKAKDKLHKNIEFMQLNGIQIDTKIVPYADFVQNSYMNADRYIAEIQHRAWNMFEYANIRDLENMMFTLTLPSVWHPKKTINRKLVNNPKFGGRKYLSNKFTVVNGKKYRFLNCDIYYNCIDGSFDTILDFSQTVDKYTPRNASKELSDMLLRFWKDRSYTEIEKDDRCFFRVTEPHKDGTPHVHMSLFVPKDKKEKVIKALKRLYPAPMGQIETNIKKPVHYLMKYVLKTFDDLRDDKEISSLTLWYLYHGISRFYTSRTFISLDIYRRLNGMYDLKDLTQKFRDDEIRVYLYKDTNKISLIENEFGTLYVPKPVNWQDKQIEQEFTYLEAEFEPIYRKEQEPKKISVIYDDKEYTYFNGRFTEVKKMPWQMNQIELWDYFKNLDIDTVDYKHYLHTRNLLADRGLLDVEKVSLNLKEEVF